ncbi:HPr family phosphocarrier protein [Nitrosomonas eutropha]|uniref:Phosphocarrier protein n=2 Tax=Nitrosomonas eutropha TaxID=916 RepID=A0ABX5MCJ1_9PROT|nr:HPr family phosphocarrier protein [Nitrosomonas eutropha]ABI58805.1 phosphocarrier, HPr family protein [Nitrosomonas eutropha C91]PXV81149.1 phosphocarrier protein [Nitrosomonas eutropha]SCX03401.1 phosphocarrier protein [Nitrosomonas eutropha]SEI75828.1 phosphocarrier protein [Nitrosomonas eutropha]
MPTETLTILNKLGLHARASAKLTQLAERFESEVWLTRSGRRVNAKSIMGVMTLAASKGTVVELETIGPDAIQAMEALKALINDYFGEGE